MAKSKSVGRVTRIGVRPTGPAAGEARYVEGNLVVPPGSKFVIVAARFNSFIVEHLVNGAIDAIVRHGGRHDQITVVHVPGAWEIPVTVQRIASASNQREALAIIALGAVIRGSTPHFDYVAGEVSKGTAAASAQTGVPIAFGVLTTDSIEQAIERAGTKAGNKGFDAALSAIEMLSLFNALDADPI